MRGPVVFLVVALLAGWTAPLRAQITAELAFRDAPRNQEWELLVVHFQAPAGGGVLSVQDSRGGFTVSCPVDSAAVDPASSQAQLLIPLPFIAEADLPLDRWPVEISIRSLSGEMERKHVEVERPAAGSAPAALRIARTDMAATLSQIGGRSPAFIAVTEEEILSGPVLDFVACDAVLLSDRVAGRLSAERLAALLNTGVQLITARDPAAGGGVLSHLAWTPISADVPRFWITVRSSYPRPRAFEPGLERVNALWESAGPTRRATWTVILIPVASLVLLFLARGLFRRRLLILLTTFVALAGLSVAVISYLRSSELPATTRIAWVDSEAPPKDSAGRSTLNVTDSFLTTSALFGEQARITAEQDQLLFPVSASARQHFARRNTILSLDVPSEDGLRRISRLEAPLGPRRILLYAVRSAALRAENLAVRHASAGDWIEGGYVTPASPQGSPTTAAPTLVTRWAVQHPTVSDSLGAWYELRFVATHRYFMQTPTGEEPLTLTDLGPNDSLAPPP